MTYAVSFQQNVYKLHTVSSLKTLHYKET